MTTRTISDAKNACISELVAYAQSSAQTFETAPTANKFSISTSIARALSNTNRLSFPGRAPPLARNASK